MRHCLWVVLFSLTATAQNLPSTSLTKGTWEIGVWGEIGRAHV